MIYVRPREYLYDRSSARFFKATYRYTMDICVFFQETETLSFGKIFGAPDIMVGSLGKYTSCIIEQIFPGPGGFSRFSGCVGPNGTSGWVDLTAINHFIDWSCVETLSRGVRDMVGKGVLAEKGYIRFVFLTQPYVGDTAKDAASSMTEGAFTAPE